MALFSHTKLMVGYLSLGFVVLACKSETSSSVKVIGGTETSEYPATVKLNVDTGFCTGTFITSKILITAAHCAPYEVSYDSPTGTRIKPVKIIPHPEFAAQTALPEQISRDMAVVIFDQAVAPATISIATSSPGPGSYAELVGFGCTEFGNSATNGIKRKATIKITGVDDGLIKSLDQIPGICAGDSGGPLIAGGVLIGINSGSSPSKNKNLNSLWSNLNSSHSRIFFQHLDAQGVSLTEDKNPIPTNQNQPQNIQPNFTRPCASVTLNDLKINSCQYVNKETRCDQVMGFSISSSSPSFLVDFSSETSCKLLLNQSLTAFQNYRVFPDHYKSTVEDRLSNQNQSVVNSGSESSQKVRLICRCGNDDQSAKAYILPSKYNLSFCQQNADLACSDGSTGFVCSTKARGSCEIVK